MPFGVLEMLARCHMTARPLRTAMTILGVALGVSVFVAIRTANEEVLRSFEVAVSSVAGKATLQVSGGDLGFDERVSSGCAPRSARPAGPVGVGEGRKGQRHKGQGGE